ncbi:MAG: prephenate dehydrogenase/arogenate dehydrogenase family protein [Armatimonadetes bacterium]|nr:prephenate dehydrogenase/arogenate dehydrogenase family protein [Armatimonadota bacterium]
MSIRTLGIAGVGLIGGSIGLAAKARGLAQRVIGVGRSSDRLKAAREAGAIDEASLNLVDAARRCDVLYLATPVQTIIQQIRELSNVTDCNLTLTDGGSAKAAIVEAAESLPANIHFVGGHPMAGSEQRGVEAASADLYDGATYVLTPTQSTNAAALTTVRNLAQGLGAEVLEMSAEAHDETVATTSHMPHVLAAALLRVAGEGGESARALTAGSFRDLTRVADSPPELWSDICAVNRQALLASLSHFQKELDRVSGMLQDGNENTLEEWFQEARDIYRTFPVRKERSI